MPILDRISSTQLRFLPKRVAFAWLLGLSFFPLCTLAQPLPIDSVLRDVRGVAPQAQAARERLAAARGAFDQVGRLPNPVLELRQENLTFDSHGPVASNPPIDFFATLSQLVELGGKRAERQAMAQADVSVAAAERQRVERELILEAARQYLGALRAREEWNVLQDARQQFQALVDTMQRRVDDGYAPEADLMRFRGEAARLEASLTQIRIERDRYLLGLGAILGEAGSVDESRLSLPPPLSPPVGDPEQLVAVALERHPELRAAASRVERAQHDLALQRARRIPDPSLTAGYKRTSNVDTLVTAVTVPLPVFDANQGNVARAVAEVHAMELEREALRRQLGAEIRALLATATELEARVRTIDDELLHPAEVVRSASRSSFREGGTNILQLVDAERVYNDARRTVVTLALEAYAAALAARLMCLEEALP